LLAGGRPDRREQAQLAQAAMGHDGEAGRRDETDQQHRHDEEREHPGRRGRRVRRLADLDRGQPVRLPERREPGRVGRGEDGDRRRQGGPVGPAQEELAAQVTRVLHETDHGPHATVQRVARADPEPERRRHAVGHGDLGRGRRVPAGQQSQHRRAVPAVRVLRA
jgi:hypothetical protein